MSALSEATSAEPGRPDDQAVLVAVENGVEIYAVATDEPWFRPADAVVIPADRNARFGSRGQAFLDAVAARGVPRRTITEARDDALTRYGEPLLRPEQPLVVGVPEDARRALPEARILLVATGQDESDATVDGAERAAAGVVRTARGHRSLVLPLFNIGNDGLPVPDVARATLAGIREALRSSEPGTLGRVEIVDPSGFLADLAGTPVFRLVRSGLPMSGAFALAVVGGRPVAVVSDSPSSFTSIDLRSGDQIAETVRLQASPLAAAFVRGAQDPVVVTGWSDGTVGAWDVSTTEEVTSLGPWYEPGNALSAAAFGESTFVVSRVEGRARSLQLTPEPDARTHTLLGSSVGDPVVFDAGDAPAIAAIDHTSTPSNIVRSYIAGDFEVGPPIAGADHDFERLLVGGPPDAPVLVTRSPVGLVERWQAADGGALPGVIGPDGSDTRHLAAGDRMVVAAGDVGPVRRFDLVTAEPVGEPLPLAPGVEIASITTAGDSVAVLDNDGNLWAWTPEPVDAPASAWRQPNPTVARDYWTTEDNLGYQAYARAIAEFVTHDKTRPPLTIGIKGPWGAGKTSVMRMVQRMLDPPVDPDASEWRFRELALTSAGRALLTRGRSEDKLAETTVKTVLDRAAEAPTDDLDLSQPVTADAAGVRRPTVWFNPWMYQTGEQVWAGLAHEIITQVTGRLPWRQRERFWLELNLRRVNREGLRHKIHVLLLQKLVLPLVVFAAGLAAAAVLWLAAIPTGWLATTLAPVLGGLGWAIKTRRDLLGRDAAAAVPWIVEGPVGLPAKEDVLKDVGSWSALVPEPDYRTRAGFLYFLQTDMKHVLDLVATPTHPLVVFIDDLDRCSPGVVTQTIEAVNLFLAGAFPNCIFVLALEPAVVAAHIETVHKDLVAKLEKQGTTSGWSELGWRFLEKIVQLPLALPQPRPGVAGDFVISLFGPTAPVRGDERIEAAVAEHLGRLESKAPQAPELAAIPAERAGVEAEARQEGFDETAARRIADDVAIRRFSRSFTDDDDQVRQVIVNEALSLPSRNPREMKRLVNLFRFYTLIVNERRVLVEASSQAEVFAQVARVAALANRWPHLLTALGAPVGSGRGRDDQRPIALESLEQAAGDSDEEWGKALTACGLARPTGPPEPDGLREFLRSGTPMGILARELL